MDSPGSYVIECRAPDGFGLVARATMVGIGERPQGFEGFGEGAGGELGSGGRLEQGSIDIASVQFTDGDTAPTVSGPIDNFQDTCVDSAGVSTAEPFFFNDYIVNVENNTEEVVQITGVDITVIAGPVGVGSIISSATSLEISPNAMLDVTGVFTEFLGGGSKIFSGTGIFVVFGNYTLEVEVTAVTGSGNVISATTNVSVLFDNIFRCP